MTVASLVNSAVEGADLVLDCLEDGDGLPALEPDEVEDEVVVSMNAALPLIWECSRAKLG